MITRRSFIKRISLAAGLVLLNPVELIEQVSTKFYSFPPQKVYTLSDEELVLQFKRVYGDKIAELFNRHTFIYDQFAKDTHDRPKGDGIIFNLEYNR